MFLTAQAQMSLSEIQISQKLALPYLTKRVFKMLVRKSAIIWERSWSLVLNIFRDLCLKVLIKKASKIKGINSEKMIRESKAKFRMEDV